MGLTPTAETLKWILAPYMRTYKAQGNITPLSLYVLTDGAPDNQSAWKETIRKYASQLDDRGAPQRQVGIQFYQVGDAKEATDALNELDDGLGQDVRDIVDTMSCTKIAGDLKKALLGAISELD